MILTLKAPESYHVPEALQTHPLPPPVLPQDVKPPAPYTNIRRALYSVGIETPSVLCADRTLWWNFAIGQVTWDLKLEQVEVRFADGAVERWAIDPDARSPPLSPILDADGSSKRIKRRSGAITTHHRLQSLSIELRNAYEDVSLGPVLIDEESDYEKLIELAADPSVEVPPEWLSIGATYEEETDNGDGEVDELASERAGLDEMPAPDVAETSLEDEAVMEDDEEPGPFEGQFISRRRPQRFGASVVLANSSNRPSSPHDVLSLIALLSEIRQSLIDLFSGEIVPELHERLDVPTYASWALTSAIRWCRLRTIVKGAVVSSDILQLLDDDGQTFDRPSTSSDVSDDEDSDLAWTYRAGPGRGAWERENRREENMKRNVLYEMLDDYGLRLWCEKALHRASGIEVDNAWCESGDVNAPAFVNQLQPWEVSRPYPGTPKKISAGTKNNTSTSSDLSRTKRTRSKLGHVLDPKSPTRAGPSTGLRSLLNASPTSTDVSSDEDEMTSLVSVGSPHAPSFFYPADPLGEGFLPPRLPNRLVSRHLILGSDMAGMRTRIHLQLNEIAGLQLKIFELQAFLDKHRRQWQKVLDNQRDETKGPRSAEDLLKPKAQSGLRREVTFEAYKRTSSKSPPSPRPTAQPLKQQPLRYRAGDNVVADSIASIVQTSEVAAKAAKRGAKRKSPFTVESSPRKKARDNITLIEAVTAADAEQKKRMEAKTARRRMKKQVTPKRFGSSFKGSSFPLADAGSPSSSDTNAQVKRGLSLSNFINSSPPATLSRSRSVEPKVFPPRPTTAPSALQSFKFHGSPTASEGIAASRLSAHDLGSRRSPPKSETAFHYETPQVWQNSKQWWEDDVNSDEDEDTEASWNMDEDDLGWTSQLSSNGERDIAIDPELEDALLDTPRLLPATPPMDLDLTPSGDILVSDDSDEGEPASTVPAPQREDMERLSLFTPSRMMPTSFSSPLSSPTHDERGLGFPFSSERSSNLTARPFNLPISDARLGDDSDAVPAQVEQSWEPAPLRAPVTTESALNPPLPPIVTRAQDDQPDSLPGPSSSSSLMRLAAGLAWKSSGGRTSA